MIKENENPFSLSDPVFKYKNQIFYWLFVRLMQPVEKTTASLRAHSELHRYVTHQRT